jgi:hypothetical protein
MIKNPTLLKKNALALLPFAAALQAVDVTVHEFVNGDPVPFPYVDVTGESIPAETVLKVSEAPFVDYLIPTNSGVPSILAQKETGAYLSNLADPEIFTDMGSGGGGNSLTDPDKWQVVFEWTDGLPLPIGSDFYGVSWANWNATQFATMTTRVTLPDTAPVRVWHFFNDGWDYISETGHTVLTEGHELQVTHYSADGTVVSDQTVKLLNGKATEFFGDNRAFFTAEISISGQTAGDYVDITNRGGNIGYKGTVVEAVEGAETWAGYPVMESGYVDTGDFMGLVYPMGDWIYVSSISNWVYLPESHVEAGGAWGFVVR